MNVSSPKAIWASVEALMDYISPLPEYHSEVEREINGRVDRLERIQAIGIPCTLIALYCAKRNYP